MPKKEKIPYPSGSITIEQKPSRGNYVFALKNNTELLARLRSLITRTFKRKGWDENGIALIELAIDEAVINAMAHGNLGINTKGLKTDEINRRIAAKNQLTNNQNKRIYASFAIDRDKGEIQISDNGLGFDPKIIARLAQEVLSNAPGQRGFLLIRRICSNIIFEKDSKGRNSVKLIFEKSHLAKTNKDRTEHPAIMTISENYIET